MDAKNAYITNLSKELKRHNVSDPEIQQVLAGVQETLEHTGSTPDEEFGSPREYVRALYPDNSHRQYYLFTLVGIILAAVGFVALHIYFRNQGLQGTLEALWGFSPLLAIPIGMLIDFTRYLRA